MTRSGPAVAMTVAGSDSGGGAGIQADLKTFEAHGVWGTAAVTGVTAQNTVGVHDSLVMPPPLVVAQMEAVAGDIGISATKTGMLGTAGVILAVAGAVARLAVGPLVVDPVLVTSHGELLLEAGAVEILRKELLPACALVTPNLPEAEALLGHEVSGVAGMREAAEELVSWGAGAALVKGGHLQGPECTDVLYAAGRLTELSGPRVAGRHTHGTGCTLSAAICARLARGEELEPACVEAKAFVTRAIEAGVDVGRGVGPVNPGWQAGSGRERP